MSAQSRAPIRCKTTDLTTPLSSNSAVAAMPEPESHSGYSRLEGLNQQTIRSFNDEVQRVLLHQPGADLTSIFAKYGRKCAQRKARRQATSERSCALNTTAGACADGLLVTKIPTTIHALDPRVMEVLDDHELRLQLATNDRLDIKRKIDLALARGTRLHALHDLAVVRISKDIVVKTQDGEDQTEVIALRHIREHAPHLPIPRLLGALAYDGRIRIFMSYIDGCSVKELWGSLLPEQKSSVRDQVEGIISELRTLPPPSEYMGCGIPPVCIDIRARKRQSKPWVRNEAEFNEFLLSEPRSRISFTYLAFLKEHCLRTNHRIVMTHGDLTPRNIIATLSDSDVRVVGLVDWECAGAYPEYWEYVKSMNTFSSIEEDDWCWYLPHAAIGEYAEDWAKNLLIEKAIK